MTTQQYLRSFARAALAAAGLCGAAAAPAQILEAQARAEAVAERLAAELVQLCPAADPADQAAFETCRLGLFRDSEFKRSLKDFVLWGRQKDPRLTLKDSSLTQFGPDVLTGMYLPLFMFNGKYSVGGPNADGLVPIRLQTAFRNRLAPGQFPYPFWHEADKWSMYQNANQVILYWDPKIALVSVAQFTVFGNTAPIVATAPVQPPRFDGQWRWTDSQGRVQPVVTVFDGLMDPANPHLRELDDAYKRLALRLREGQCLDCHVPNNPDRSKRLVLLQTPMHAAAEIKRVMASVLKDRMPRDEAGIEQPLDRHAKAVLLQEGAAFERVLDLAKAWEATRLSAGAFTPALPLPGLRSQ